MAGEKVNNKDSMSVNWMGLALFSVTAGALGLVGIIFARVAPKNTFVLQQGRWLNPTAYSLAGVGGLGSLAVIARLFVFSIRRLTYKDQVVIAEPTPKSQREEQIHTIRTGYTNLLNGLGLIEIKDKDSEDITVYRDGALLSENDETQLLNAAKARLNAAGVNENGELLDGQQLAAQANVDKALADIEGLLPVLGQINGLPQEQKNQLTGQPLWPIAQANDELLVQAPLTLQAADEGLRAYFNRCQWETYLTALRGEFGNGRYNQLIQGLLGEGYNIEVCGAESPCYVAIEERAQVYRNRAAWARYLTDLGNEFGEGNIRPLLQGFQEAFRDNVCGDASREYQEINTVVTYWREERSKRGLNEDYQSFQTMLQFFSNAVYNPYTKKLRDTLLSDITHLMDDMINTWDTAKNSLVSKYPEALGECLAEVIDDLTRVHPHSSSLRGVPNSTIDLALSKFLGGGVAGTLVEKVVLGFLKQQLSLYKAPLQGETVQQQYQRATRIAFREPQTRNAFTNLRGVDLGARDLDADNMSTIQQLTLSTMLKTEGFRTYFFGEELLAENTFSSIVEVIVASSGAFVREYPDLPREAVEAVVRHCQAGNELGNNAKLTDMIKRLNTLNGLMRLLPKSEFSGEFVIQTAVFFSALPVTEYGTVVRQFNDCYRKVRSAARKDKIENIPYYSAEVAANAVMRACGNGILSTEVNIDSFNVFKDRPLVDCKATLYSNCLFEHSLVIARGYYGNKISANIEMLVKNLVTAFSGTANVQMSIAQVDQFTAIMTQALVMSKKGVSDIPRLVYKMCELFPGVYHGKVNTAPEIKQFYCLMDYVLGACFDQEISVDNFIHAFESSLKIKPLIKRIKAKNEFTVSKALQDELAKILEVARGAKKIDKQPVLSGYDLLAPAVNEPAKFVNLLGPMLRALVMKESEIDVEAKVTERLNKRIEEFNKKSKGSNLSNDQINKFEKGIRAKVEKEITAINIQRENKLADINKAIPALAEAIEKSGLFTWGWQYVRVVLAKAMPFLESLNYGVNKESSAFDLTKLFRLVQVIAASMLQGVERKDRGMSFDDFIKSVDADKDMPVGREFLGWLARGLRILYNGSKKGRIEAQRQAEEQEGVSPLDSITMEQLPPRLPVRSFIYLGSKQPSYLDESSDKFITSEEYDEQLSNASEESSLSIIHLKTKVDGSQEEYTTTKIFPQGRDEYGRLKQANAMQAKDVSSKVSFDIDGMLNSLIGQNTEQSEFVIDADSIKIMDLFNYKIGGPFGEQGLGTLVMTLVNKLVLGGTGALAGPTATFVKYSLKVALWGAIKLMGWESAASKMIGLESHVDQYVVDRLPEWFLMHQFMADKGSGSKGRFNESEFEDWLVGKAGKSKSITVPLNQKNREICIKSAIQKYGVTREKLRALFDEIKERCKVKHHEEATRYVEENFLPKYQKEMENIHSQEKLVGMVKGVGNVAPLISEAEEKKALEVKMNMEIERREQETLNSLYGHIINYLWIGSFKGINNSADVKGESVNIIDESPKGFPELSSKIGVKIVGKYEEIKTPAAVRVRSISTKEIVRMQIALKKKEDEICTGIIDDDSAYVVRIKKLEADIAECNKSIDSNQKTIDTYVSNHEKQIGKIVTGLIDDKTITLDLGTANKNLAKLRGELEKLKAEESAYNTKHPDKTVSDLNSKKYLKIRQDIAKTEGSIGSWKKEIAIRESIITARKDIQAVEEGIKLLATEMENASAAISSHIDEAFQGKWKNTLNDKIIESEKAQSELLPEAQRKLGKAIGDLRELVASKNPNDNKKAIEKLERKNRELLRNKKSLEQSLGEVDAELSQVSKKMPTYQQKRIQEHQKQIQVLEKQIQTHKKAIKGIRPQLNAELDKEDRTRLNNELILEKNALKRAQAELAAEAAKLAEEEAQINEIQKARRDYKDIYSGWQMTKQALELINDVLDPIIDLFVVVVKAVIDNHNIGEYTELVTQFSEGTIGKKADPVDATAGALNLAIRLMNDIQPYMSTIDDTINQLPTLLVAGNGHVQSSNSLQKSGWFSKVS